MPDWRDELLPASFRGVNFKVNKAQETFGRAVAVHDYPQGQWFPEDVGQVPESGRIEGFVLGDDYLDQRERLKAAFLVEGPGVLVHPWIGTLLVQVGQCEASHSSDQLASWGFTVPFHEFLSERGPAVVVDSEAAVAAAVDAVNVAAGEDLAVDFVFEGFPSFVLDEAVSTFNVFADEITRLANKYRFLLLTQLPDIAAVQRSLDIGALVATPVLLVEGLVDFLELFEPFVFWFDFTDSIAGPRSNPTSSTTPSELQVVANSEALAGMFFRLGLAFLVRAAAARDFESFDDAVALRDLVVDRINVELELTTGDSAFRALSDLRTEFAADITRRATDLAELRTLARPPPGQLQLRPRQPRRLPQEDERLQQRVRRLRLAQP